VPLVLVALARSRGSTVRTLLGRGRACALRAARLLGSWLLGRSRCLHSGSNPLPWVAPGSRSPASPLSGPYRHPRAANLGLGEDRLHDWDSGITSGAGATQRAPPEPRRCASATPPGRAAQGSRRSPARRSCP